MHLLERYDTSLRKTSSLQDWSLTNGDGNMKYWKVMYLTTCTDMCEIKGTFNVDIKLFEGTLDECQIEARLLEKMHPRKTFSIKGAVLDD